MDQIRKALCEVWPFFGLILRTPRLELKLMLEHELAELANRIVVDGIHDEDTLPFYEDWALWQEPECQRRFMKIKWQTRGNWLNDTFSLAFGIYRRSDDMLMGCFDLSTKDVRLSTYTVDAWLLKPYQNQHYGQEAGQALLHLIFQEIGAERAEASHWDDNPRSGASQAAAGAESAGDEWKMRRMTDGTKKPARMCKTRITPDTWLRPEFSVEIDGFESCRALFCPKPETGKLPNLRGHVIFDVVTPILGQPEDYEALLGPTVEVAVPNTD